MARMAMERHWKRGTLPYLAPRAGRRNWTKVPWCRLFSDGKFVPECVESMRGHRHGCARLRRAWERLWHVCNGGVSTRRNYAAAAW